MRPDDPSVRCPFCHARVHGSPERCPACDFELGFSDERRIAARLPRRGLVVLVLGLVVAAGVYSRAGRWGGHGRRNEARSAMARGLEALKEGYFGDAAQALDEAIRDDGEFAEAYLARGMARLGLGEYGPAVNDAREGGILVHGGRTDAAGWSGAKAEASARAGVVAERIACVARVAHESALPPTQAPRLVALLGEVTAEPTCSGQAVVLERWRAEPGPLAVLSRARRGCASAFRCAP